MSERREFLRPAQVAPQLGVTTSRVYQLIAAGVIPAIRVGGAIRVPRAAWEEWLRGRSEQALASLRDPCAAPGVCDR
jgi:excisionase family DNA binding protein